MSPKWSKGYSRLGLAKFKAGDLAGSIKAYTSGLAQDPDNTQIADGLAEVRARPGGRESSLVSDDTATTKIRAHPHVRE
jgi:cytochrome c-type biogenesis protein CcmH/NrfG